MSPITIKAEYESHSKVMEATLQQCSRTILEIADIIIHCFQKGNKILLCGNGGSAADAQHVAAEFVNRFRFERGSLPAIALTTDTSILTAVGNDSAFEIVFSRQVEALARPGDIVAGISTSGKSANILKALEVAHALGATTLGVTGQNGQESMLNKCDHCLVIPSTDTPRIQECHLFAWHVICGIVEETLFKNE